MPGRGLHLEPRRHLISEIGFIEIAVLIGEKSLPVHSDGKSEQHHGREKKVAGAESCIASSLQQ